MAIHLNWFAASYCSEVESCLSPEPSGVDESDGLGFTPYPHRPQIHCMCPLYYCVGVFISVDVSLTGRYDHSPELLGSLKQESLSILNDALVQRGIPMVRPQAGVGFYHHTGIVIDLECWRVKCLSI